MNFDKKFQSFKNQVNHEVLGGREFPNNTFNAYKAVQMSYKSDFNQQEPLNKNPFKNQSKLAKMEKPKKTKKKTKKTSPKFEICGSLWFFWEAIPPPPPIYTCYNSNLPKMLFIVGYCRLSMRPKNLEMSMLLKYNLRARALN